MRLRNVPGADDIIKASPFSVEEPQEYKGKWRDIFHNDNPIHIEIGMGKGQFICEMARRNPDINYIGIEMYSSVLVRATQKSEEFEGENLRFLCFNAENISDVFEEEEVDRIYLNFSDPWPKERHAKRRLTSTRFLERYDHVLKADGRVMFKTDNRGLFDFSLEQIEEAGWILEKHTFDLHNSDDVEGNVMTEYEQKFSSMGHPICRLVAYRQK